MKTLTIAGVKENNKNNLIKIILKYPDISRSNLAKESGLSGGTVTALTKELIAEGKIDESKVDYKTGGRPRVGLRVKSIDSNILIVEVKQRSIVIKSFDIYDNLLSDETFKTNYLNGNYIVDTIVSYLDTLDKKITKVGLLIEENIIASEISYMLSTGVSQSQISLESAMKMYIDVEVVLDYSLKYYLEECLMELAIEEVELCAYINFNDLLSTFVYNRNKPIELKDGIPLSINLSNILEKIGYKGTWKELENIDLNMDPSMKVYDRANGKKANAVYKKFVQMIGDAIMTLQIFYPLDAIFFLSNGKNLASLDESIWNYIKKQPSNKLKLVKNVVPEHKNVAKNMNHKLLVMS